MQFELIAELNNWNDTNKALYLAASLRGIAMGVLSYLNDEERHHYPSLIGCLTLRFGPEDLTVLHRARLDCRKRGPKETLPELAHEIRKLVKLTLAGSAPCLPSSVIEDSCIASFIKAMTDFDMVKSILFGKPKTLNDALKIAVETEAIYEIQRSNNLAKQAIATTTNEDNCKEQSIDDKVQHLEKISPGIEPLTNHTKTQQVKPVGEYKVHS